MMMFFGIAFVLYFLTLLCTWRLLALSFQYTAFEMRPLASTLVKTILRQSLRFDSLALGAAVGVVVAVSGSGGGELYINNTI